MHLSLYNSFNTQISAHTLSFSLTTNEQFELNQICSSPTSIILFISETNKHDLALLIRLKVMRYILRSNIYLSNNLEETIQSFDELNWANFIHYFKLFPFEGIEIFEYNDSGLFAHHVIQNILKYNIRHEIKGQAFQYKLNFNSIAILNDSDSFYFLAFYSNQIVNNIAVKNDEMSLENYLNSNTEKRIIESDDVNDQIWTIAERFIEINDQDYLYVDKNQFYILDRQAQNSALNFPFKKIISNNLISSDLDEYHHFSRSYFSKKALIHLKKIDVFNIDFKLDIDNHEIILNSNTSFNNSAMTIEQIKLIYDNKVEFIELNENQYAYIDHYKLKNVLSKFQYKDNKYKTHRSQFHKLTHLFESNNISFTSRLENYKTQLSKNRNLAKNLTINNFQGTLRAYQEIGVQWLNFIYLNKFGGILADDMGLGKTIQILAFLSQFEDKKILIITPKSLKLQWSVEIARFIDKSENYQIKLTHYEQLISNEKLFETNWDIVIFDEVHKLKNSKTQIYQAANSLKRDVSIGLTGTPIENNLSEYWALFDLILKELLNDLTTFKKLYLKPYLSYLKKASKLQANDILNHLRNLTKPYVLKRFKTDKLILNDIPEKIEKEVFCELTKHQKIMYKELINKHLLAKYEKEKTKPVLTLLLRLKQCCDHPILLDDSLDDYYSSGKMELLKRILDQIKLKNEKVIIFTQFKGMLEILFNYLSITHDTNAFQYHGSLSNDERDENINAFKQSIGFNVFLISIKAGGVGLNLTEANHVIHFDRWWNPAVESQASDRVHRIGQLKNVMIYKFITKNTIEEYIDKIIKDKTELIDDFFEENIFKHIEIKDLEGMILNNS